MRRICVYCGSNGGNRPAFTAAARDLGHEIAARGLALVFGGSRLGMMGAVADGALTGGAEVIGVIPEALHDRDISHAGVTELRVVADMHARKALQEELGDAFIAMPGGYGTFEEIMEMLTWAQLRLHSKPCGFLNVGGYFDRLLDFFDEAVARGFVKPEHRAMVVASADPGKLLDSFAGYRAPAVGKWIGAVPPVAE